MQYSVFVLVFFVGMSSCASESENLNEVSTQVKIGADSLKESTAKSIEIDVTTEERYAYIKEVFINNSELYVKADYVDYLTGDDAVEAEQRDETYFVEDGDTVSYVTDGYYISNQNDKLRTFRLSKDVEINIFFVERDSYEIEEIDGASLSQLEEHLENNPLLILHVKEGIIVEIEEQFLP